MKKQVTRYTMRRISMYIVYVLHVYMGSSYIHVHVNMYICICVRSLLTHTMSLLTHVGVCVCVCMYMYTKGLATALKSQRINK